MVNIRHTLAAADAPIAASTREALLALAKATHYRQRSWPRLLADARAAGLPAAELVALAAWLPRGRVDQKKRDAVAMLRAMRARAGQERAPKAVRFQFQNTDAWEQVRRAIDRRPLDAALGADTYSPGAVLDELRLDPEAFAELWSTATARALAARLGGDHAIDKHAFETVVRDFCLARDLSDPECLSRWLEEQGLQPDEFARLLEEEARIAGVLAHIEGEALRRIPAMLRLRGAHAALARRARAKQALLASRGLETPSLAAAGLAEQALWQWYFGEKLRRAVPEDLDAHARACRFASVDALQQAVLREYLFVQRSG
jgi:hypothetical protein